MPTYDYQCKECGYQFEEFQSMSAVLLIDCPSCGKPALKRLFATGVGMIFKGSGFYQTDYKKSSASTSSPGPKSETHKPDTKPASPAATKSDSPASDK